MRKKYDCLPIIILLYSIQQYALGDVIFTSERCNRATYGLRTVNGDPTRYKQCGPSGRVWIVPCAPQMTFDPQDRVCKERADPKTMKPMRKYEIPKMIITTPAPPSPNVFPAFSPPSSSSSEMSAAAEEFVFSTIRPKRPRIKARTRTKNTKKMTTVAMAMTPSTTPSTTPITTTIPTTAMTTTTTQKMIVFAAKKHGGPAFTRPGRMRTTTTTTPRPVTHATKFLPGASGWQRTTKMPEMVEGKPHTLAPYEKRVVNIGKGVVHEEEMETGAMTTMKPEYTVRYNGKSMTENEFLSQLLHIVQHQKAVAELQQQRKFEKMEQDRLRQEEEERAREMERRRRIEEAETQRQQELEKQAALFAEQERLAMEREREIERIRQEERRRELEMERKRKNERIRQEIEAALKQKELEMEQQRELERQMEIERQQEIERHRQLEIEKQRRKEEEEENQRRLVKLEKEKAEREKAMRKEAKRREEEERRRQELDLAERMELEEKRRQAAEERAQLESIEKERQMIRQIIENERNMLLSQQQEKEKEKEIAAPTVPTTIKPIYRPQISEYQPPEVESQMIRFTTQSPEWVTSSNSWKSMNNWNTVEVEEPPVFQQGCVVNGPCELKYDYDFFCQHPTNPSKYLQCAPLYGRNGQWAERHCPDTLEFVVSLGRCEKSATAIAPRKPYDPDNRVVIPRLPSETAFVQWAGNRVIDAHTVPPQQTRVYPPIPETHQPQIYNTIEEFPKDLLPNIQEPNSYAQQYQNHIHGSVISGARPAPAPAPAPSSYRIPQEAPQVDNSIKSEIDLSHIHPLFPRVQPDFLSRIIPALNFKLQDEKSGDSTGAQSNPSLGSVVKPVIKQLALNQTEMFLDRLLADEAAKKLLEKDTKDRLKSSN